MRNLRLFVLTSICVGLSSIIAPLAFAAVAGEDCDDAFAIATFPFLDSDNTTGHTNNYDLDSDAANGDCGSGQAVIQDTGVGPDLVYQLNIAAQSAVTMTVTPAAWNAAVYVLHGSCNPGGFSNTSCAGLSDAGLAGEVETVRFIAGAGQTYFIVVDGVTGGIGAFDITVDACPDADADGVCDSTDNCPSAANADQADSDSDGPGDACDDCPNDAAKTSPGACGCGAADTDTDADGVSDCNDNCVDAANADQADADGDGVGDACTTAPPAMPCGLCGGAAAPFTVLLIPMLMLSRKVLRWSRRRTNGKSNTRSARHD